MHNTNKKGVILDNIPPAEEYPHVMYNMPS